MWIFLVLACTLLSSTMALESEVSDECLSGWRHYPRDKTCMKVFSDGDGESYHDALSTCKGHGGYLVEIQDLEKNSEVEDLLKKSNEGSKVWIATFNPNNETYELFYDRKSETFVPASNKKKNSDPNQCRRADPTHDTFRWNYRKCTARSPFICERPDKTHKRYNLSDVDSKTGCLSGWRHYPRDQACMKVFSDGDGESYHEALAICKGYDGYLVEIQDLEKNSEVEDLMKKSNEGSKVWIATFNTSSETYELFYDRKTETFVPASNKKKNSDPNQCRRADPTHDTFRWNFKKCTARSPFICEMREILCQDGWTRCDGDMSCIKVESNRKLSWHDAQAECQLEGGDLFLPLKGDKANFVIDLQKKNTHYWVGFDDKDENGEFNLINGGNMTNTLPWRRREPNNAHGNEHCGEMKNGLLFDKRCGRKRNFVCESPLTLWTSVV